ncbi:class I SAM-dependent methyltransferase [Rubrobacter aplysinae]|uniref:class I SAM-dependent methyltransferase n=1 Tax=Rubrobacter aplysinae TaxID=909625 RepID=UPI00069D9915|nr:class I SAM-dependent methyltransferase [Rubrobacter aplysinae]
MPRFEIHWVLPLDRLRAVLRPEAGTGEEPSADPAREAERLARGLHDARRTSQKRKERISTLQAELDGLRTARAEDRRWLHYLLSDAFERRGPWVTGIEVDGRIYGRTARHKSPRLEEFFRTFPEASGGRILEPGSLEGAMTVELAKRAEAVVGLEGRPRSVERAEFLKGLFGTENATFHVEDLEETRLSDYGEFDAVFCCGVLYHLARPRLFVESMAATSPNLYLDTQYARPEWELTQREGLWGWVRHEDPDNPQSGLSETAFWPTLEELYRLLYESGYGRVETLDFLPDNRHGPRVHVAASRP